MRRHLRTIQEVKEAVLYVAASVNKDVMRSALGKILKRAKLCVKSKGSTFDEDLSIEHAEKTTKIMTHL
jgi:ribosomal protein L7/L12